MKRKYVAVMLGAALSLSSIGAFAEEATTESTTEAAEAGSESEDSASEAEDANTLAGTITEITDDTITLSVGDFYDADSSDTIVAPDEAEDALGEGTALELHLSGESLILEVADSVTVEQLDTLNVIDTVEGDIALASDSAEAAAADSSSEDGSEATDANAASEADNADADAASEADGTDAENSSEDTDGANASSSMDVTDLLTGDVVVFTLDDSGAIASVTLLGVTPDSSVDTDSTSSADDSEEAAGTVSEEESSATAEDSGTESVSE